MSPSPPTARLAIVLSHPTQYYSPWFRWLRASTTLVFRVFYLSDTGLAPTLDEKFQQVFAWDVDLTSGYDWELVPNTARRPDTLRYDGLRNPTLHARLAAWHPSAILLFGYNYHPHVRLIAWARLHRIPLIFRGDSHLLGRPRPSFIRRTILKLLYRQFAAVTFVGQANRDYFRFLGVPDRKLFFAPHAVDSSRFDPGHPATQTAARSLRTALDLPPDALVILFAGKLIAQKQPRLLLESFLALAKTPPAFTRPAALVFVGDGPEKSALQSLAASSPHASVRFLPFANQSEMPARYLLADLFALPSRGGYETWGLAVNEAMHLGVPCLVSDHVGCQHDLVANGETGWVFRADSPESLRAGLASALATLSRDAAPIRATVSRRIAGYTYAQTSSGLLAALQHIS